MGDRALERPGLAASIAKICKTRSMTRLQTFSPIPVMERFLLSLESLKYQENQLIVLESGSVPGRKQTKSPTQLLPTDIESSRRATLRRHRFHPSRGARRPAR